MSSINDRASWAQFEKEFVVENKNNERRLERQSKRYSDAGSKSWMDHPVAATSSIAPLPPPPIGSPRGTAVSTERWSKQVKVKVKKSSASRRSDLVSPSAKSISSLPTEFSSTHQKHTRKVVEAKLEKATCSTTSSSSGSEPVKTHTASSRKPTKGSEIRKEAQRKISKPEIGTSRSLHVRSNSYLLEEDIVLPSRGRTERTHAQAKEEERRRSMSKPRTTHGETDAVAEENNGKVVARRNRPMEPVKTIQNPDDRHDTWTNNQTTISSATGRGRSSSSPRGQKETVRSMSRTRSASLTRITNVETTALQKERESKSRRHPPSTFRTQQEMRRSSPSQRRNRTMSDDFHGTSRPHLTKQTSAKFEDEGFGCQAPETETVSKRGIMEKLFGNQVEKPGQSNIYGSLGFEMRPRVLLAATVYHNAATNLWITTINTNQKGVAKNPETANKHLKAFTFNTEEEARQSAIANAPPKMVPFQSSPCCFVCKGSFAVFRRPSHCKNCGICICSNCTISWNSKNIPGTYNLKNDSQVKVCQSCNGLSMSFRRALLAGDFDEAIAIYNTGNINLRTPFPTNKKEEVTWPVHCAVEGGNLRSIRWLIDQRFCPIKYCSSLNKKSSSGGKETVLTTSKGRSVLSIAIDCHKVDVMRYLVVDCNVSVYECKEITSALRALEVALMALPHTVSEVSARAIPTNAALWDKASFDDVSEPSSLGAEDHPDTWTIGSKSYPSRSSRSGDRCIICRSHAIDCVSTPCGHQVCCFGCSTTLNACPICNDKGKFIKIYKQ